MQNVAGTTLTPSWSGTVDTSLVPQCSYSVSGTSATTATLNWSIPPMVCTPGGSRSCCAYQRCGCPGHQTCTALGQWTSCGGSIAYPGVCP